MPISLSPEVKLFKTLPDLNGGGQIFQRCTDRFKNGDGVATGAARMTTLQNFRQIGCNIIETEDAFLSGEMEISSFTFGPCVGVHIDFAAGNTVAVSFSHRAPEGAHQIKVATG